MIFRQNYIDDGTLIQSLPLSWSRKDIDHPGFKPVYLPLSKKIWIHSADIPSDYSFEQVYGDFVAGFGKEILIRGCGPEIAGFLARRGFEVIRSGAEGVIDLKNIDRQRASVKALVKRGIRRGEVEEIPFTELNSERVSRFTAFTSHGGKPNLKYLFRTRFDPATRCFIFRSFDKEWLGALTVSTVAESYAHTEMILRYRNAPAGIMEALFDRVMKVLREDGYRKLSLGEVPFITPRRFDSYSEISKGSVKEKMVYRAGQALRFAFDYKGLFCFKDKFNPEWRPVYICSSPKISWSTLADLYASSHYFDLTRSEMISAIKGYSTPFLNKLLNVFIRRG